MFPIALTTGNTFIMKPSEQDPGACILLAQMAVDCGVPDGVLNVIHGTKPGNWKMNLKIMSYFMFLIT